MQVPRIMRRINRAFTNPLMGTVAGRIPPLAMIHHVGRKSGRKYQTPVVVFATNGGYVTPLPYGTDTDWCLNLVEAGQASLETGGRKVRVSNPRVVRSKAGVALMPAAMRPALRLASLPGYLLLDRGPRRKPKTRRKPAR